MQTDLILNEPPPLWVPPLRGARAGRGAGVPGPPFVCPYPGKYRKAATHPFWVILYLTLILCAVVLRFMEYNQRILKYTMN